MHFETSIQDEVTVIKIEENRFQATYHITFKSKTYIFYATKNLYDIGDILYINADIIQFENKTRPFGIDLKHYYYGRGVFGSLHIHDITFVKSSFHINQLRDYLIKSLDSFKSKEIIQAYLFDIETSIESDIQFIYLMRISGLHILVLLELIRFIFKKIFFHPIFPFVLSLLFFYLQAGNMSMIRLVLYYGFNTILFLRHIQVSRQIKLFATWVIALFLFPYLIFNSGLMITFIIIIALERLSFIFKHYSWITRSYLSAVIIQFILLPFNHKIHVIQIVLSPILMVLFLVILFQMMLLTLFFPIFDDVLIGVYQTIIHVLKDIDSMNIGIVFKSFTPISIMLFLATFLFVNQSKKVTQWLKRVLMFVCFLFLFQFRFPSENIEMIVLDVGQGDATIIHSHACTIVIDSFQYVKETLYGLGIHEIDYLFITHKDIDHYKELESLNKNVIIHHLITNPFTVFEGMKQTHIFPPESVSCGNIKIDILGPLLDYKDDNDNSLILNIKIYDHHILFMGDASKKVEQDLLDTYKDLLEVNIIKVGHHGSNTSTDNAFINAIQAKHAIISVGRRNRYGMPHKEVLQTLSIQGLNILRTDLMGTIRFRFNSKKMTYEYYEP